MSSSLSGLKGQRVVITAAGSGIGRAIAESFAHAGARVHICDIDENLLLNLRTASPHIGSTLADVGDPRQVDRLFDDAIDRLATSPYHEVRFVDQARPGSPLSERRNWTMSIPELLGRIRAAQSSVGASTPILVRLPATRPACREDISAETTERTGNAAVSTGPSTPKPNGPVHEDSHTDNGSPHTW